ncbi:hypothetical protein A2U01_0068836, partial [Trifolium medium]|nr:hypothetical protein [Trifolium medium]
CFGKMGTSSWQVRISPSMEAIPEDWKLDTVVCLQN